MGLAAGTKLGPYEILSPLGAGGMGEGVRLAGQSRSHSASGTPSASSQAGARNRALAEAQRGVALAHESKYEQAVAHYRAAEALDHHLPSLYLSLRLAYFKAQRLSDAAVALERAVKADPDPDGHYHLGRLMLRMGQRKEAMQEFSEMKRLARDKHPPPFRSQIGGAKKGTKPDRTSAVPEVGKH